MKPTILIALIYLTVIVNGVWWAAAAQPIIIGMGALFAAIDMDLELLQDIKFYSWKGLKKPYFGN